MRLHIAGGHKRRTRSTGGNSSSTSRRCGRVGCWTGGRCAPGSCSRVAARCCGR